MFTMNATPSSKNMEKHSTHRYVCEACCVSSVNARYLHSNWGNSFWDVQKSLSEVEFNRIGNSIYTMMQSYINAWTLSGWGLPDLRWSFSCHSANENQSLWGQVGADLSGMKYDALMDAMVRQTPVCHAVGKKN